MALSLVNRKSKQIIVVIIGKISVINRSGDGWDLVFVFIQLPRCSRDYSPIVLYCLLSCLTPYLVHSLPTTHHLYTTHRYVQSQTTPTFVCPNTAINTHAARWWWSPKNRSHEIQRVEVQGIYRICFWVGALVNVPVLDPPPRIRSIISRGDMTYYKQKGILRTVLTLLRVTNHHLIRRISIRNYIHSIPTYIYTICTC